MTFREDVDLGDAFYRGPSCGLLIYLPSSVLLHFLTWPSGKVAALLLLTSLLTLQGHAQAADPLHGVTSEEPLPGASDQNDAASNADTEKEATSSNDDLHCTEHASRNSSESPFGKRQEEAPSPDSDTDGQEPEDGQVFLPSAKNVHLVSPALNLDAHPHDDACLRYA